MQNQWGMRGSSRNWLALAVIVFLACSVVGQAAAESVQYVYYTDGQLHKAIYSTKVVKYVYDASGNRTSQTVATPGPAISAAPTALAFDTVNAGTTSAAQPVTITNTGEAALTISSITVTGANAAEFSKQTDTCSGQTIQAGGTCTMAAVFQPAGPSGAKTAALRVTSNAANAPTLDIALTGTSACSYTISPITATYSFAAASGSVNITTQPGCAWDAQSEAGWLAFTNGTGRSGSGTVNYTVSQNASIVSRNVTVTIAGQSFSVTQAGEPCAYTVTPVTVHVGALAATANVTVTSNYAACGWNVQNLPTWITANPTSSNGNGSIAFTMPPNTEAAARSAVLTIAGKPVTMQQWGTAEVTDILFRNTVTGEVMIWLMDGATRTSSTSLGITDLNWQITGRADFNGDGKQDIMLRNTATGANTVWYMDGAAKTGTGTIGTVSPQWSVIDLGDMNGDGKPDILWRDTTTGQAVIWFMDGVTRTSSAGLGVPTLEWAFVERADFNGDGKPDILWRNATTGANLVWYMDGATRTGTAYLTSVALPWTIAGLDDFNSDGKQDILWRNPTTGGNILWYMDGITKTSANAPAVAAPWEFVSLGDFNGDGKPDILWRNATTSQLVIWFMDGATRTGSAGLGAPGVDWQVSKR